MNFQKKFILVIVAFAVLLIGWIAVDFKSQEVPFISVEDLLVNYADFSQDRFRLGGNVVPGSITFSEDHLTVQFRLSQGNGVLPVTYTSAAVPDLFADGSEVIVEGAYSDGVFQADNLMTKCASRYELEDGYETMDEDKI